MFATAMRSAALALGCLGVASAGAGHKQALPRSTGGRAYFLLTFDMLSEPGWPAKFAHYGLFITQPTHFTAELVRKVKRDVPGAKVLAYFDAVNIPIIAGCSTGSPMGNNPVQRSLPDDPAGYYKQLRSTFQESWVIRDLGNKSTPICVYPGLAGYVLMQESADAIVAFHKAVTLARGYDGLYVDMLTDDWWVAPKYAPQLVNVSFDCDGDGKPNTFTDLETQWKGWRPYLIKQLRSVVGQDGIIIGNSAGAMSLPGLNGVTIEMEWCGTDMSACLAAIKSSRAVATQPPVDVFWLTQATQVPPAVQCKIMRAMIQQFPAVYAGDDWFDGSHIVCNASTFQVGRA